MVNIKPVQLGKTTRMSFSKINEVLDMPNLIEVQKNSYNWFLNEGLKEVFRRRFLHHRLHGQPGAGVYRLPVGRNSEIHG